MPRLAILVSAVLILRADRQTDRQTDRITDAAKRLSHVTTVGVSNYTLQVFQSMWSISLSVIGDERLDNFC